MERMDLICALCLEYSDGQMLLLEHCKIQVPPDHTLEDMLELDQCFVAVPLPLEHIANLLLCPS